jgi:hypothetical protein
MQRDAFALTEHNLDHIFREMVCDIVVCVQYPFANARSRNANAAGLGQAVT